MGSGFGLFSIQERLKHLGGNLTIESGPGKGTRVVMSVPHGPKSDYTKIFPVPPLNPLF
jgi:glucose-6-phosphate-specific signal transduction histidine kinase